MMASAIRQSSPSSTEICLMLKELQDEAVLPVLPCIATAGVLLAFNSGHFADPMQAAVPALLLILLPLAVWRVRGVNGVASAWILVGGCLLVDLLVVAWSKVAAAICLLMLPAGLAALTLNGAGGIAIGAACTLLLVYAPASLAPTDPNLRAVSLVAVWSTVGLVCLTRRPLLTTVEWSWSSYQQNRRLLERARDYQVQLKQTLADLADANLQLTRLNRLADALRQAAEEARRAKERFVANVSHELRTPLNMIIGFSEMMLQAPEAYGSNIPPALLADLKVILHNSQHVSGLIDDVLDLSQIEVGRMALTKERVPLPEIIEAAAAAVRPLFESKGLYLKIDVPEELPAVLCDRTRIREVLLNLLSNAGRFTERGGVRVRAWGESTDLVVSVADTGPGIASEDMGKIFRPFEQLDGSLRRRHGGSGLGLSISKSFVELHGGRMWLESERGAGTTFFFRLPIDPPAPMDAGVSRWFNPYWYYEERTRCPIAPAAKVQPRFVIFETGDSLQRLLNRYLGDVELVPVRALDDARQELARVPAQALLINDLSVGATLQRLNEAARLPYGTPVIICSLPGTDEAGDALGVAGYLVKPVSRDALLAALDRLPTRPRTVLVVDDEPETLQLFWRMLASAGRGYRVLTAAGGREALEMLNEERPDAVLLDLAMPDMNGFQLLEARSADPVLRSIPVVVTTARDPAGQPMVTSAVGIMRCGGLSTAQLLACIEGAIKVLSTGGLPADPAPRAAPCG